MKITAKIIRTRIDQKVQLTSGTELSGPNHATPTSAEIVNIPLTVYLPENLMFRANKRHLKLRDLSDPRYFCSIIGTCLSLKELRLIADKSKITLDSTISDYDLHGYFVSYAKDSKCYVHRQLQKYMDKKFQSSIREFSSAQSDDDLRILWQRALESADVAGAYFALVTHPATSTTLQEDVFGDIHMLSHLSGASLRIDMQKYTILKARVKKQDRELADKSGQFYKKDKTIQSLSQRLTRAEQFESKLRSLQAKNNEVDNTALLRDQLEICGIKLGNSQERSKQLEIEIQKWKAKTSRLEISLLELESQHTLALQHQDHLELNLANLLEPDCGETCGLDGQEQGNKLDLCGRCILYVGGRSKQCHHFRRLTEQYNGRFIHHDGGLEDGDQRLSSILSQADTVMCPLDCISHDAMNKVKRHCHNTTKPLVVLPHSSLSAFTKGLSDINAH